MSILPAALDDCSSNPVVTPCQPHRVRPLPDMRPLRVRHVRSLGNQPDGTGDCARTSSGSSTSLDFRGQGPHPTYVLPSLAPSSTSSPVLTKLVLPPSPPSPAIQNRFIRLVHTPPSVTMHTGISLYLVSSSLHTLIRPILPSHSSRRL